MPISVLINQRPNCSSFSLHKSSPFHSNVNRSVSFSSSSPIPPKSPKTTIIHLQEKKRSSIQNMNMVGLDIGNDTSLVAVVKTQAVHVLLNTDCKYETPSVVSFAQNKRQIGSQAAVSLGLRNPIATISQIKRIIGKRYRWPGVGDELSHLPFLTTEGPDGGILIHVNHAGQDREFTPVQILAMLFSNLRKTVETNSGGISTSSYVIGVPSYFTDSQRIAYLDAAEIAGMDRSRLQLMHEGTATALGYGFYKNDMENGRTVVVFVDVGHCSTQVTVVEFKVGRLRVLSHASDRNVGGRDFDRVLFDHFRKKFHEERKIDIVATKNWRSCARLMAACEKAKKDLTSNSQASVSVDCLVGDLDASGFVTRKDFEEMSRDLLVRIVRTCEKALWLEGIDVRSVSSVELTGSGSRIPAISEHVSKCFGKKLSRTLNGSECVARGCALQCVLTSRLTSNPYKVEDVFPFTVGYYSRPSDQLMLLRGQQFPYLVEYNFKRKDSLHLDIYQVDDGESPNASNTRRFEIGPSQVHGNEYLSAVKVHISLSRDGIVNVYASLLQRMPWNDASEQLLVTDISGCGMQQNALINAKNEENDLTSRDSEIDDIQEKRNALEAYVYDIQKKLTDRYCNFSSDSDKRSILKMLEETESWLYEDSDDKSKNVYCDKLHELKELLRPIENRYTISERNFQKARDFRHQIDHISNDLKSWSADKTNEIQNMYNEADQWLLALQQLLDLLPRNIEQVLFVDDIMEKMKPLIESFEHIKRGETSDCGRRETTSSHPGPLSTAMSFVLSLPMKFADSVGSFAFRSSSTSPGIDGSSNEFVIKEPSDLTCDNRSQPNSLRHESKPNETPKAHMKEIRAKFMEWFGNLETDFEKNEISTQTELTMQVLNRENRNDAEDMQSIIKFFRLAGEGCLDEEANAAAVRDLLYCIFQYKVQVISSSDFIKEEVHKKCREIEECLKVRKIPQDKEPKPCNPPLRFRDILDKMEELEACYRTTVQHDATQNHQIDSQNPESMLSGNNVLVDEVKKNTREEDGLYSSEEREVATIEGSKDAHVGGRPIKEEVNQGETSDLQTPPLSSDVSLPSQHVEIDNDNGFFPAEESFKAEAKISKNDDKFRDTETIADSPVPDKKIETSGNETNEASSSPSFMDVD